MHDMIITAKEAGHSIVYITHNVHHVYPIADRFVILDRGKKLAEVEKKDVKPEDYRFNCGYIKFIFDLYDLSRSALEED